MSEWIQSKPLEEITWEDLTSLISDRVSEGQQIEFKQGIPGDKANGERWEREGKLADSARNAICAELSAFLNTYGGVLFLGVEEEQEDPRPAKNLTPISRAAELAKRLEDVIRSFDPPTNGVSIRAVPAPDDSGKGILVFRVSKSSMAPHGFGNPSVAYVRRGALIHPH
jgi:predicted HTH transcriptional regulator